MDPTNSTSAVSLTVQVCFPGSRAAVMDNLNRQREEGRLCDLSIHVQGQVFRAHRCVLAASSPYFHDQVLLKNVTTVSLPSVMDPVAFESVLSSAYTGQLSLVHEDIVNYVTVASFLQMWHIVDKCTEILKRPRPSADGSSGDVVAINPGSASRQQSPSSTNCLYSETEVKKKDKKPDALPPLATWRRPQQFPRWRPRTSSDQHLADSQLEGAPSYANSYFSNCEESWVLSHAKSSHFAQEVPGQNSRLQGVFTAAESLKQKVRLQQRGEPSGADRASDKNRERRESDESREKRKNERREIEADEGVGEETQEKKENFVQMGSSEGVLPVLNASVSGGQAAEKSSTDLQLMEREQRVMAASDPPSSLSCDQVCQTGQGVPGPSCPTSARLLWQTSPWSQQEQRLQAPEGAKEADEDEGDVDLECLAEGTLSRETFDEIEDGTGQISQRPLVPMSPDFTMGGSAEPHWPSTSSTPGGSLPPSSNRHTSQPSATFPPPPSSPPTPSSSSSVSLAGASYTGKVHFCHCGKAYTLKSMRDRHVKMQHLNLRPFGCPVCTKSFKMKHHLTKHLKTHGGLRPFECSVCGKKVVWRDSFLRHQARCQRLASGSSSSSSRGALAAAAVDMDYGYGFEDGEAFLAADGQVKVEDVDFSGEMEDGMSCLLGSVPGMVDQLRTQEQNLSSGHVFKEEASESFIGN